jgi:DNA polymerase-4
LLVPTEGELAFLHPLPVQKLWGVGAITAAKLHERGITTVGEVAELEERSLIAMLGPGSGRHLHALAHNRDPRPVQVGRRRRSIGAQRALGRRVMSEQDIDATLVALVDRVARRLRTARRLCRTVVLRLRFDDFSRATRSHTLPRPTTDTDAFVSALRALVAEAMPMIDRMGLTLIGVTLANLDNAGAVQLELPFGADARVIDGAVDSIRDRFGTKAITRAVLLGRDPGMTVPLLPD